MISGSLCCSASREIGSEQEREREELDQSAPQSRQPALVIRNRLRKLFSSPSSHRLLAHSRRVKSFLLDSSPASLLGFLLNLTM
jgi:hypothetical protein